LNDWFAKYALWYRPSAPGAELTRPDLPVYELPITDLLEARQVSKADLAKLDLAAISTQPQSGDGWRHGAGFSPDAQKTLPNTEHFVFRAVINLPPSWKPGQPCELNLKTFGPFASTVDAYLNGKQVLTRANTAASFYSLVGGNVAEVGPLLQFGKPNVLVFTTGKLGFMGDALLIHHPVPVESLPVTGEWQVQANEESGLVPTQLPGTFTGLIAFKRDVMIPASWKGNRVFIQIDAGKLAKLGTAAINDQALFLFVDNVTYADITPWIKFGQANTLTLIPKAVANTWTPGPLEINRITLERVTER